MTSQESLLALNLLPGLGPIRIRRLLDRFGDAEGVLRAREAQLTSVNGIGPESARVIHAWEDHVDLPGELSSIRSRSPPGT